ncbi:structural maintenance of chromosomes protein 5-like [Sinocyclocheilus grahami]|uniref:structural maintenance of chromosomes protein 5-like n=1 Tax=Sinocyclocheilus grahami TaxID=75366 RepID=UPI0007ACB487|nr:PREDICTED: structural maintenance of chromosomes protein 5-like [Sinocyclocheilus grahami]
MAEEEKTHAAIDVQVPLEQHDTEIADMEPLIVKDLLTAVGWLWKNCHAFRGFVEEPWYLKLNQEDQEKALQFNQAEINDDQQLAKEPFMFCFQFKEDMDVFLCECLDKRHLRINSMFMEF